ncbi:G2/mitotic-specific cyclin-1 [Artemisia annua]|uniref:G2/mitotic-specific cyclin-1 n=1 Tax=Artemisia annua TaxID=35608 RepID=A0A2U1KAW2_ARTAN|nr:G2/mitotic-specific cyclin-1 [Artemisia annua]
MAPSLLEMVWFMNTPMKDEIFSCEETVGCRFSDIEVVQMAELQSFGIKAKKPTWKFGSSFSLKKTVKSLPKVLIDDDMDLIDEDSLLSKPTPTWRDPIGIKNLNARRLKLGLASRNLWLSSPHIAECHRFFLLSARSLFQQKIVDVIDMILTIPMNIPLAKDVLKPKQSTESFKVWEDVEDQPEPMSLEISEPQKDHMEVEMDIFEEPIVNIINLVIDAKNPLAVVQYVQDLYTHYRRTEVTASSW